MINNQNLKTWRRRGRRQGVAAIYMAGAMLAIIAMMAYCIDMSWLYSRKTVAQKAADAAALAGAYQLAQGNPTTSADAWARYYAALPQNGGYNNGDNSETPSVIETNTTVANNGETVIISKWDPTASTQTVKQPNYYKVSVSRAEPTFFAPIVQWSFRRFRVGASATALYETNAELNIKGVGSYGVAPGPVNLSLFGPDAQYNNGDKYSTKLLANKTSKNPDYNGFDAAIPEADKGYSFALNISDAFRAANSKAYLQIFDPDCYNTGGIADANGTDRIDELRNEAGSAGSSADATTTKYRLWWDPDGDGDQPESIVSGSEKSYGGSSTFAANDMIWNDFYAINLASYPKTGTLRLQVISTDGSSENGFDLRLNKQLAPSRTAQLAKNDPFVSNNGTTITAQGHLPINFNTGGQTTMTLGYIPAEAAGGTLTISKFDTDVTNGTTANTLRYKCDPPAPGQPANGFPGVLSGQGETTSDTLNLPTNYTGGTWSAIYSAGAQDTSVWDMAYSNHGPGRPGRIRLIE